ncbi:DUF4179 domain-containing protein [Polycladomyces subterraneus]|uniref:DUF4179 domain-containing protein n=1 Tax=Polycladomyces subterraneus TaxID=1016997 RepID=A0ABT8INJ5_9BACL|nr:DUF4179 domain-containing protein [Polycladomyces subterraneus]MDN4593699.1 DUF4179 domain-containing protein [Polycladomyces subterraneus]
MICSKQNLLEQWWDGFLEKKEVPDLEQHLRSCSACQTHLAELKKEKQVVEEWLNEPVLHDSFTEQIMAQIRELSPEQENEPVIPIKKKRARRRRMALVIGSTVAILAIFLGIGTAVSPAFANFVKKSIFLIDRFDSHDGGLKLAAKNGFSAPLNKKITSSGYTVELKEVIADPSRITVDFQIRDANGKLVLYKLGNDNYSPIASLVDENGKVLAYGHDNTGDSNQHRLTLIPTEPLPNKATLRISANVLRHFDLHHEKIIKGSWNVSIPLQLDKGISFTRVAHINQTRTFHGVDVQLHDFLYSPSAMSIQYSLKQNEQEKKQLQRIAKQFPQRDYSPKMDYEITDNQGKILAYLTHDDLSGKREENHLNSAVQKIGVGEISKKDLYDLHPLKKGYFFRLKGIVKKEAADAHITFNPQTVSQQPVSFNYKGNLITITYAGHEPSKGSHNHNLAVNVELKPVDNYQGSMDWHFVDDKGKVHNFYGSAENKNGVYHYTLVIDDIVDAPKQLILVMDAIDHYYPAYWEVPLRFSK